MPLPADAPPQTVKQLDGSTHGGSKANPAGSNSSTVSINKAVLLPSWQRLQLLVLPHQLRRESSGAADPRITGFVPDNWQRRLLDVVDKGSCALDPSDGVVVIVLPTKALVNQLAAQVYNDFGAGVHGVFTRDFRMSVYSCRVLLTVPACLEILMLTPANRNPKMIQQLLSNLPKYNAAGYSMFYVLTRGKLPADAAHAHDPCDSFAEAVQENKTWLEKVRWVIFDEVHCISELDGGDTWERLLLTVRCPWLALSATVGNPEAFVTWLQRVRDAQFEADLATGLLQSATAVPAADSDQAAHSRPPRYQVQLIMHSERYNELLSQVFVPGGSIVPAADASSLMAASGGDSVTPSGGLVAAPIVGSKPAGLAAAAVQLVLSSLSARVHSEVAASEAAWKLAWPDEPLYDRSYQRTHLMQLVLTLREAGQLPAILFNFERSTCTHYAFQLMALLTEAEDRWRVEHKAQLTLEIDKVQQGGLNAADASRPASEEHSSDGRDRRGSSRSNAVPADDSGGGSSGANERDMRTVIVNGVVASVDEEMPDPSFTFLTKGKARSPELWGVISDLAAEGTDRDLLQALARGIGVHHSGLDTHYRQAVEMLFRSKHLQVVIATGTLAQGIHMPCATVVMAGDSGFLDALNFRQMSGRAGRRGLDDVGHVVFYSLPKLASATSSILTLAAEPFLAADDASAREQLGHMTDFGLAYLAASHLIDSSGQPVGLADLACHLYWTDPANFVLARLLSSGVIHRLVAQLQGSNRALQEALALIFAGLFERKPLHPMEVRRWQGSDKKLSPSKVILPPLPADVVEIIQQHNQQVLLLLLESLKHSLMSQTELLKRSGTTTPTQLVKQELQLPLSGLSYDKPGLNDAFDLSTAPEGSPAEAASRSLLDSLAATATPGILASPFMALSGAGDDFQSLAELLWAGKQWLRIHVNGIPMLSIQDRRGQELTLNAWALDYFKHQQK
eukprot:gene12834-12962_t